MTAVRVGASATCTETRNGAPCDFRLRLVEFDNGIQVERYECDACGGVRIR